MEIDPGLGFVRCGRVATHAPPCDEAEAMPCAMCNALAWVEPNTIAYLAANRQTPLLCCSCAQISIAVLQRFLRDRRMMVVDVPDLSQLGNGG